MTGMGIELSAGIGSRMLRLALVPFCWQVFANRGTRKQHRGDLFVALGPLRFAWYITAFRGYWK